MSCSNDHHPRACITLIASEHTTIARNIWKWYLEDIVAEDDDRSRLVSDNAIIPKKYPTLAKIDQTNNGRGMALQHALVGLRCLP